MGPFLDGVFPSTAPSGTSDLPPFLSQTGAFANLALLEVRAGGVPYDLVDSWSDGAVKKRWIFLPNDGTRDQPDEQIVFHPRDNWEFPVGTVLMQHFELPLDESDPSVTARLETRFFVHGADGRYYGLSYRWLPDQSDAELVVGEDSADFTIRTEDGGTRQQSWQFPAASQCPICHSAAAGPPLGPRTHQLNRDFTYPSTGRRDNQLRTWNHLGMFDPALVEGDIPQLLSSPEISDPTVSLEDRARSWLDSNCAYCHRPETGNRAAFDARYETPLEQQGLVWGGVVDSLGIPDAFLVKPGDPLSSITYHRAAALGTIAMPPLLKNRVHEEGTEVLADWITRLQPGFPHPGIVYEYYEVAGLSVLPDFDALTAIKTDSIGSIDISVRDRDDDFAFRFTGFVEVPDSGDWTFYTSSDEGSQLWIDGVLVVDNDGLHDAVERSGTLSLAAGFHAIVVTMFEASGQQVLETSWSGPGTAKQPIPSGRLFQEIPIPTPNQPPVLGPPDDRQDDAGAAISLLLDASDPDGDTLFFSAQGLPEGLALDPLTGRIQGTLSAASAGDHLVTVGVSDGPAVDSAQFVWTVVDATGTSSALFAAAATPICGNGIVEAPEVCDDGNTLDGDGCAADCTLESSDLSPLGTIIARVTAPQGGGNYDPEIIRDGDLPPPGSGADDRQYDTWDGDNSASEDWIGYSYTEPQNFTQVIFQEGIHFEDGGWFDTLTVQVRQGGVWVPVQNLVVSPPYPGNNGISFETFTLDFTPIAGDAIRLYGAPGGSADFISVGELRVFGASVPLTCGDGSLDPGEECDDGNTQSGDGCGPSCAVEFCGDGIVNDNGTETCEPPDTASCDASCQDRTPLCGDGLVTAPEACDDGNTQSGDGCAADCTLESAADLTHLGSIIARVTAPQGAGSYDLETIRDGVKPPVGSTSNSQQYDTWDGSNTASEDWIGYSYSGPQTFGQVVFQEGRHFSDGGWFDTLTVQVRQGGVWVPVQNLVVSPPYIGNNGISYETFVLDFAATTGDGIRLYGSPGGVDDFISVGELEVYGANGPLTCGNGSLDPGEECDDGNTQGGDGCGPSCAVEFCGDGIVNDNGTEACEPPDTATCDASCQDRAPLCGDGFVTAPEACDDGNTLDGDGCAADCTLESNIDLTQVGSIIARVMAPTGGGNHDPETIRDGIWPPVGSTDDAGQYDTWDGSNTASEDWIGYSYTGPQTFHQVVFQEGKHFSRGGWFDTLTVQVRQGGVWVPVQNLVSSPPYPGNNGVSYETFVLDFAAITGDGIRLYGAPGGSDDFISVGELHVFGESAALPCDPVRIMPLGDSITYDDHFSDTRPTGVRTGYRQQLWLDLVGAGYNVDFVGGVVSGDTAVPAFDPDNEGHPGWRDDQIRDNVVAFLTAHPADVVLLHIGTNALDPDPTQVEQILDRIDSVSPDIVVVLARIIQDLGSTCPEPGSTITQFNDNVEAMAQARIAAGDKIRIVDMECGAGIDYDPAPSGDMFDELHPADSGYRKMAAVWFAALVDVLPSPGVCGGAP